MARPRTVAPDQAYAELFAQASRTLPGAQAARLCSIRERASRRFFELGLPTTRVEEWKYSNVIPLAARPLPLARPAQPPLERLAAAFVGGAGARRLVFINGHLVPSLSHLGGLPEGVRILSLERMAREFPDELAAELESLDDGRAFTALNAALCQSGAWIEIPEGVQLEPPLQLLFFTTGEPAAGMSHPRIILRLGAGARLHLLETRIGEPGARHLANRISDLRLGAGSELVYEELQAEGPSVTFIGKALLRLEEGARLTHNVADLGGGFLRSEIELHLLGPGIEAALNGLYLPVDREHVDSFIRVHHEAPGCHSDQFYKGVVRDRAHAVFAGRIMVYRDAQKTNAYQANSNLLLSDEAEVDTKPELEIFADDVKCSHGATVGALDPQGLFYLRARGLPKPVAESLLTYAFAGEVLERFRDPALRRLAARRVLERVPGGEMLEEEGLL